MYEEKYLKYKQKYLELKQKTLNYNIKQMGGGTLFPVLICFDKDQFKHWYENKNKNSFEILLNLFDKFNKKYSIPIEPYNILIGATCMNSDDYFRFKDSSIYSLYIDSYKEKEDVEKQYYMYTISYENLQGNFYRMMANSVEQIHFDTGVSYFAPIDYLELAEHILVPGGKIIWDLTQHSKTIIYYHNGKFKKSYDMTEYTDSQMENIIDNNKILIDTEEKNIIPLNDDFFTINTISPQINIMICEYSGNRCLNKFSSEPYRGFNNYCRNRFSRLDFTEKTYTFANYEYPVPIRHYLKPDSSGESKLIINIYNDSVNYVINEVLNLEEKLSYINKKKLNLDASKIDELVNRIIQSKNHKEKIVRLIPSEYFDDYRINSNRQEFYYALYNFISGEFNKNLTYIEATKIF